MKVLIKYIIQIIVIFIFFNSCKERVENKNDYEDINGSNNPFLKNDSLVSIFSGYDFSNENYALVFENVAGGREGDCFNLFSLKKNFMVEKRLHFFIDSKFLLDIIQKTWKFKKGYSYDCWYDYFIYLTLNDSVISEMRVNIDCEELRVDNFSYLFDSLKMKKIIGFADTVYKLNYLFKKNKQEGLNFWSNVDKDSLIILKSFMKPNWVDSDGKFRIKYHDFKDNTQNEVKGIIEKKIKSLYPEEVFTLDFDKMRSVSKKNATEFWYFIICRKSLYEEFKLFEVNSEWIEYDEFNLEIYRRR